MQVVHEGRGAYYGVVPASVAEHQGEGLPRVWVVSRPHNWRPKTTKEALLLIDTNDGSLIEARSAGGRRVRSCIALWLEELRCSSSFDSRGNFLARQELATQTTFTHDAVRHGNEARRISSGVAAAQITPFFGVDCPGQPSTGVLLPPRHASPRLSHRLSFHRRSSSQTRAPAPSATLTSRAARTTPLCSLRSRTT